jgi:NADH dehydrogenase/NADH:ubiquinone oxidoreductase subunit G
MVTLNLNGMQVQAQQGSTLLEVAQFYGIDIPTLCYYEGLSPYGACRLCTVEVKERGKTKMVASCLYPVKEGIEVKTHSRRVVEGRKILIELLLSRCPNSKTLQDLASKMGLENIRFKMDNKECILCGLCVRMCDEQMEGGAIGFTDRGKNRSVSTPFHMQTERCRNCGACMYICPMVEVQCKGKKSPGELCNSCLLISPECLDEYDRTMCYLESCSACVKKGGNK